MAYEIVSTLDPVVRAELSKKLKTTDRTVFKQGILLCVISFILVNTQAVWANMWFGGILTYILLVMYIWIAVCVLFLARWPAAVFV